MTLSQMELVKVLADLGGTVLITALLIWFAWKVIRYFGTAFLSTMQQIARAMSSQAACLADMKDTVTAFVAKDNSEHREILLSLQVVAKEISTLTTEIRRQRHDDDGC